MEQTSTTYFSQITTKKVQAASINCTLSTDEVESQGSKPIFELIKTLGGMPMLGDRIKGRNIEKFLGKVCYRVAENYFEKVSSPVITMRMEVDPKDTNSYVIEVRGYGNMSNQVSYKFLRRDFLTAT